MERSQIILQAHFRHPAIEEIHRRCFDRPIHEAEVSDRIQEMTRVLKEGLCV